MNTLREQRGRLVQMATAKLLSKPLYIATKLGIADQLAEGPKSAQVLAGASGVQADALYRVLRALASVGLFVEDERAEFALTSMSQLLRDRPDSLRPLVLWMNDPRHDRLWEELLYCVETGRPAAERAYGMPFWQYLASQPDLEHSFSACMAANARAMHAVALENYTFPAQGIVVDVGGCFGELLSRVLSRHAGLTGVVFDRPEIIVEAQRRIESAGLRERCRVVAGDFLREVPAADLHLLSHILHDFGDCDAKTLLDNCHRAARPGARIVLIELPIPARNEPSFAKLIDLEMLVLPGGRERTLDEYRSLLLQSGYGGFQVTERSGAAVVMEATALAS